MNIDNHENENGALIIFTVNEIRDISNGIEIVVNIELI